VRLSIVAAACYGCSNCCCFFPADVPRAAAPSVWSITRSRYYSPYPLTVCLICLMRLSKYGLCERVCVCVSLLKINVLTSSWTVQQWTEWRIDFSDSDCCCDFSSAQSYNETIKYNVHLLEKQRAIEQFLDGTSAHKRVFHLTALGGAAVWRRTRDRKVAGSTPGRGAIKSTRSTQPSILPG